MDAAGYEVSQASAAGADIITREISKPDFRTQENLCCWCGQIWIDG
jgi:hypothetical protein